MRKIEINPDPQNFCEHIEYCPLCGSHFMEQLDNSCACLDSMIIVSRKHFDKLRDEHSHMKEVLSLMATEFHLEKEPKSSYTTIFVMLTDDQVELIQEVFAMVGRGENGTDS